MAGSDSGSQENKTGAPLAADELITQIVNRLEDENDQQDLRIRKLERHRFVLGVLCALMLGLLVVIIQVSSMKSQDYIDRLQQEADLGKIALNIECFRLRSQSNVPAELLSHCAEATRYGESSEALSASSKDSLSSEVTSPPTLKFFQTGEVKGHSEEEQVREKSDEAPSEVGDQSVDGEAAAKPQNQNVEEVAVPDDEEDGDSEQAAAPDDGPKYPHRNKK